MCLAGAAECQAHLRNPPKKTCTFVTACRRNSPCHCRSRRPEWERSVWRPLRRVNESNVTDSLQTKSLFSKQRRVSEARPTFQNFLQVLLGEDGAARVGRVGDNQAGCPLVNQTLQMLEVDLPRLLRLREQKLSLHNLAWTSFQQF